MRARRATSTVEVMAVLGALALLVLGAGVAPARADDTAGPQDLVTSVAVHAGFTRTFAWSIEQTVDVDEQHTAGSAVFRYVISVAKTWTDSDLVARGTVSVHNPNEFPVADVSLALDDPACSIPEASAALVVAGGADAGVEFVCGVTPGSVGASVTAVATWSPDAGLPSTSSSATGRDWFAEPDTIVGAETVHVSDADAPGGFDFWDTGAVQYAVSVSGDPAGTCTDRDNTATVDGTDLSATVRVRHCVGADLTVAERVEPTFTRTYTWGATNGVNEVAAGAAEGVEPLVSTVAQTGYVDSDHALSGVVTITNPNDWEDVIVALGTGLTGGTPCRLDLARPRPPMFDGSYVTVPAGASVDVGFVCPRLAGAPDQHRVLVFWPADAYSTPGSTAMTAAAVDFVTPTTTVNQTVTVTASFAGRQIVLGTLTATDDAPYAVSAWAYTSETSTPPVGCRQYVHVTRIVETHQAVRNPVEVCSAGEVR